MKKPLFTTNGPFVRLGEGRWLVHVPMEIAVAAGDVDSPARPKLSARLDGTLLTRVGVDHGGSWSGCYAFDTTALHFGCEAEVPSEICIEPSQAQFDFPQGDEAALIGPFHHHGGHAWSGGLPEKFAAVVGDNNSSASCTPLVLYENDKEMGKRHAYLVDIAQDGGGSHIHWGGQILFSASDNSDPNTNDRHYKLKIEKPLPRVAAFGSCQMGKMLRSAAQRGWAKETSHFALTHYTAEVLQLIRNSQQQTYIPQNLLSYIAHGKSLRGLGSLELADHMFLEICNNHEIIYRDWFLNRAHLREMARDYCFNLGHPEITELARKWYEIGILKGKSDVREETAQALCALLPEHDDESALRKDIIRSAYMRVETAEETEAGIRAILDAVPVPTVLVLHTLRYMPDGRPVRFPAGFHECLRAIAEKLHLPVLDTASLVLDLGVERSLTPDLQHHTQEFIDALADKAFGIQTPRIMPRSVVHEEDVSAVAAPA